MTLFIGIDTYRDCGHCGMPEGRVFTDSWTGKDLCLTCLVKVADHVTNSPQEEGDNLDEVLDERAPQ